VRQDVIVYFETFAAMLEDDLLNNLALSLDELLLQPDGPQVVG